MKKESEVVIVSERNLCDLYSKYNRREYVHPDPLEFLYHYEDPDDREITALIASSLAYGNVKQILKSVKSVLDKMGNPRKFVVDYTSQEMLNRFSGFKHRFTTGEELATMLFGIKSVLEKHGSLNKCFFRHFDASHANIVPALTGFVAELSDVFPSRPRSLLPSPTLGSACKRLNLFLRWVVRQDDVDPGGWNGIPASKLVVPVDVHMHRMSLRLEFTRRKQANMQTALEITAAFKKVEPEDPVRYDFVLTRFGIRDDLDLSEFLRSCGN